MPQHRSHPGNILAVSSTASTENAYSRSWLSLGITRADRLFDIQDTRKISPAPFILCRQSLAWRPGERLKMCQVSCLGIRFRRPTPFSWKEPSSDEQPGPPFVLKCALQLSFVLIKVQSEALRNIPEYEIVETSFWTRGEEPEE